MNRASAVAPPVGAWTEMFIAAHAFRATAVDPPVGALIEMSVIFAVTFSILSLPPWERGLKSKPP